VTVASGVTAGNYYGALAPSGTVTYYDGTLVLKTVSVTANSSEFFQTSFSTIGQHVLTAVYSGDKNFATSATAPTTVTVEAGIATATTLSASASIIPWGGSVTLTAKVSLAPGLAAGLVSFVTGPYTLCTTVLDKTGTATCTSGGMPIGVNAITAKFGGYENYKPSQSSAVSVTLNPPPTATKLAASPTTAKAGATVTLTATVTSTAGAPTGTVTFMNGKTTLGSGSVNSLGMAVMPTTSLPVGTDSITAVYGGTPGYSASTSTAVPVVIVN
jgi:hypothetical protein